MMISLWHRHRAFAMAVWLALAVLPRSHCGAGPGDDESHGRDRAGQGGEGGGGAPVRAQQGRGRRSTAPKTFSSAAGCTGIRSSKARTPAAALPWAPATGASSVPTTPSTCGEAITFSGYKRIEAEFLAPRLFNRRGVLSVIGGWREATTVGFYGIGTGPTSVDDRANYSFTQPYVSTTLDFWPTRRLFVLRGGLEFSQWSQEGSDSSEPSVEEVYTPETLPGLGASPTYLHVQGTAGFDSRTSPGYTRRGGFYGVTAHQFADTDDDFSFTKMEYEAIHHFPVLRDAWVLSLRARVETTHTGDDEQMPFFMLPALGGGSSMRGFASWRFRDRNSVMLQAEWRVLANRFLDMALFVDAGKVTARASDLNDFHDMKKDYGLGFRLHGPLATPLRIELAKSNEGLALVFCVEGLILTRVPMRTSLAIATLVCALTVAAVGSQAPRFYDDDPISREPEPQDASKAEPWDIGLLYDLSYQLFATSRRKPSNTRAQNINTIDEVPDSSWFTNRIGARALSVDEVLRGTNLGPPPSAGALDRHPGEGDGIRARVHRPRRQGRDLVSLVRSAIEPRRRHRRAGDRQPDLLGAGLQPGRDVPDLGRSAPHRHRSGGHDPAALGRASSAHSTTISTKCSSARRVNADGTYRAAAARLLPGKILGGFRYEDTRPDDPNDIVPHEHRRELRALRVFGAWTNLTDMKAGNTLDALVTEDGRSIVKHYLQDVGSTFGIGANGPHDWDEGFEYFYEGGATAPAPVHVRLWPEPVADGAVHRISRGRAIRGRPVRSRRRGSPTRPTAAYLEMRADDAFWAARRVMAFSDEMIRAVVQDRRVQRPGGREVPGRRADQAPRRDRARLSHRHQPDRRSGAGWRGRVDVRERRGRSSVSPRRPSRTRRRGTRSTTRPAPCDGSARRPAASRASQAPRGSADCAGGIHQGGLHAASAQQPAWARRFDAIQKARERLEAGRTRTDARAPGRNALNRRLRDRLAKRTLPDPRERSWVQRLLSPIADVRRERGGQRPADDAGDVPDPGRVLPAEDGPRGLHPQRGRRRGEELLVGRPGGPAARSGAGLRRVRVARQPRCSWSSG